MDEITVHVDAVRDHRGRAAFPSIWCTRTGAGNAVDGPDASWKLEPRADEPTVVVVGAYCRAKDDDGGEVTHTLGVVCLDLTKDVRDRWYDVRDLTGHQPLVTGRARIVVRARLAHKVPLRIPRRALRKASQDNLARVAPYGDRHAFEPYDPKLKRIHAPYFNTSTGVTMPSGAFLLQRAVVDDADAVVRSMDSRLQHVLNRHGLSAATFAALGPTRLALQAMVEAVSFCTLRKVRYTPDTQKGRPTDRWETVRLPGSFAGDCEDCAKDLVLECLEWSRHAGRGSAGVDAVARLLDLYVPVMVQGAVSNYRHTKRGPSAPRAYLNHEWAALHPRKWFEHVTGLVKHRRIPTAEASLPTLLLEGTGEVMPFQVTRRTAELLARVDSPDLETVDASFSFYRIPVACSTPVYADRGVLDFLYIYNGHHGVPFRAWMKRAHGVAVATRHEEATVRAMRLVMSLERPIRAYTDLVETLRPPSGALKARVRASYTCRGDDDPAHQAASAAARKLRDAGVRVDAQVARFDGRYVCEWLFNI